MWCQQGLGCQRGTAQARKHRIALLRHSRQTRCGAALPHVRPAVTTTLTQVLGAKVRLMSLQESLLELELDAVDAVSQLCQVGLICCPHTLGHTLGPSF